MSRLGIIAVISAVLMVMGCAERVSTSEPTPAPTPASELLGGEDRRACGLYWESYEWVVVRSERDDKVRYFTNDAEVGDRFITFRDGCRLEEYPTVFRGDDHSDFDVEQFRVEGLELYHNGKRVAK